MCIFCLSSHLYLSSNTSLSLISCVSLSFHVWLSLFSCLSLSLHVSLSSCLSPFTSLFSVHLCVVCCCACGVWCVCCVLLCVWCVWCVVCCVLCVVCVSVLCVVRFFLSGTEQRSRVYVQKRSCVYFQNARVTVGTGVLNVHTGESLFFSPRVSLLSYVSLFHSRSLCSSLSVSCRLSLSLSILITKTMIARPVGSLCTHGPILP